ncbi:MAG: hypothetical protein U1F11_04735 [Steroidobacteraceae bacterium]
MRRADRRARAHQQRLVEEQRDAELRVAALDEQLLVALARMLGQEAPVAGDEVAHVVLDAHVVDAGEQLLQSACEHCAQRLSARAARRRHGSA